MILNNVKLPHFNNASEIKTMKPALPQKVVIGMAMNAGAPCVPVVKKGDEVQTGQLIGDSEAFVSAPVHASVSGTVAGTADLLGVNGKYSTGVIITASARQTMHSDVKPPVIKDRDDFIKAIRASGSIGLGGAGFPTHVKLTYDKSKFPVDTLVINGAECEPYITSDYREFMENSDKIIDGVKLLMKYLEIPSAVIGIERDKPKAIALMRKLTLISAGITVKPLPLKYPQGAEKILVYQTTGRVIEEGKLPLSAGCVVLNASTAAFIADYIKTGVPLIRRRVTVDGDIVNRPVNLSVPIGITLEELLRITDLRTPPERVIFGGPMMGNCVYNPETPIGKTTNAVLLFGKRAEYRESACIRCGKCVYVCSMNLSPVEINNAFTAKNSDLLKKLRVNLCMNCGACSYICPARRNVAEKNRLAKQMIT